MSPAFVRRVAVGVAMVLTVGLTACSSTTHQSTPTTTATTAPVTSTSATSTTIAESDVEGTEIDSLPTVPSATSSPGSPNLSTATGQSAFLRSVFNDIQSVWSTAFSSAGARYAPARLTIFQSQVSTGCGVQNSNVGPFYCPADHGVYLDLQFFQALQRAFGVGGDFAEAYVVAHEVGHHVQNLLGINARVAAAEHAYPSQANALSVGVELQADCLAGVWAHTTYERNLLGPGDIEAALKAAQTMGDDFLAKASGSPVNPDSFTHGTSAQRQQWFTTGFESGRAGSCDTFAAS